LARQIAEQLGYLPLALDQAAAYITQTHISYARYLDLLHHRAAAAYEAKAHDDKIQATVARLWDITMQTIHDHAPHAVELLRVLACFAPDDIPRALFGDDELTIQVDEWLGVLASYSMITLTVDTISVHRLVQAVSFTTNGSTQNEPYATARESALAWLQRAFPEEWWSSAQDRSMLRALIPHIEAYPKLSLKKYSPTAAR